MNIFYTIITTTILLLINTSHAATLILDGTTSFSQSPFPSVHQTQLYLAITKAKSATHTSAVKFRKTPKSQTSAVKFRKTPKSQIVLNQAYNFNFVEWYLKDEISLEDLLQLAHELTSLQPCDTDKQPADSVWKTALVIYNLSFCSSLLSHFK